MIMTAAEWEGCTDPTRMLDDLASSGTLSERKARLFAVACSRTVGDFLTDERSRQAVEIAEQYADGLVGRKALSAARRNAFSASKILPAVSTGPGHGAAAHAAVVALCACRDARRYGRGSVAAGTAGCTNSLVFFVRGDAAGWADREAQCHLIRCIFGNPFRPRAIDPAWLGHGDGTVVKLAQAVYDDRAFDRLPVLADALEEGGCRDADVLGHCRELGEHVRGCWVVDLILSKDR